MTDYKLSELSTIGAFAESKGITPAILKSAVDKQEIKWVERMGAMHLYLKTDLVTALGATSQAHKVGYVHPDKYRELQDLHAETTKREADLQYKYNLLFDEYDALVKKFDELTAEKNYNDSVLSG